MTCRGVSNHDEAMYPANATVAAAVVATATSAPVLSTTGGALSGVVAATPMTSSSLQVHSTASKHPGEANAGLAASEDTQSVSSAITATGH